MKVILSNCVVVIFLLFTSCSTTKIVSTESQELEKSQSITVEEQEQAEAKFALLKQMFETNDGSQVKSNFGKGIIVAGYEEPMASMVIDAAAQQAPSMAKMEIIKIIKIETGMKVIIEMEPDGKAPKENTSVKFFRLNDAFEFVELQLFDAQTDTK